MEIESTTVSGFEKIKVPEQWHEATFVNIKDISPGNYKGDVFDRVAVIFEIVHAEKTIEISKICRKFISPKSQLGLIIEALGGVIGEEKTNTDGLVDKNCKILTEDYKDKDGDMVSGINKVKALDSK